MTDILIGIHGPRNQIWLLAALSLPYSARLAAMDDIAAMVGTNYAIVQSAASRMAARRHAEATAAGQKTRAVPYSKTQYLPAQIKAMMVGKAQ